MFVNPVLIGVVGTILVELGLVIVYSIYKNKKEWEDFENSKDSGNE